MGQEPKIPRGFEDLPRPTAQPAAPDGWTPRRPGDMSGPEEVPWGGAFGTPGPDTGFAIRVVRGISLPGGDDLRRDVEAAVIAVVAARASVMGRAPTRSDAEAAVELLGLTDETAADLAGISHDPRRLRELVADLPRDRLA